MEPKIAIIVAKDSKNGIGCSDGLPWHIPDELKYFKSQTNGKPVIMGRNTYVSIKEQFGGPLPNRTNIVMSRGDFECSDALVYKDLDEAIKKAKEIAKADNKNEIFVIGGEQIFRQAISKADIVYLTKIDAESNKRKPNAWLDADWLSGDVWELKSEIVQDLQEKVEDRIVRCHFQILEKNCEIHDTL